MAMPFLDQRENGMNLEKMEKKSNLDSFWAFIVFIIMYISAFYFFNLSPSTLVCTTKFWFIISNTLIFIILADYGAFSSSQTKTLNQYYTTKNKPTTVVNTLPYFEYEKSRRSNHHAHAEEHPPEKIIGVVPSDDDVNVTVIPTEQKDPQLYMTDQENENSSDGEAGKEDEEFDDENSSIQEEEEEEEEEEEDGDDDDDEEEEEEEEEEKDEFSRMSDEEVNKRVEEFIRRFNTQIRLQALKN